MNNNIYNTYTYMYGDDPYVYYVNGDGHDNGGVYYRLRRPLEIIHTPSPPSSYRSMISHHDHDHDETIRRQQRDVELMGVDYESVKREFDAHKVRYGDRDWNGEFQEIYDRSPSTPFDIRKRTEDMTRLRNEFEEHCKIIARGIVLSRVYPSRPPLVVNDSSVGGKAGGEKFVVGRVLYKFATDVHNIYGGNDQEASKAALLELKAMNALIDANHRLIHTTLVCVFRYRGFCVYTIALAPIKDGRLVYGSDDAGKHVHDGSDDRDLAIGVMMKDLSITFHLRSHGVIEKSTKTVKELCHAIDIECHVGGDGRVYVFDVARESPPTPPVKSIPHSFLTRQFRFEMLGIASEAGLPSLSSDSFSAFCDPREYDKDVNDVNRVFVFMMNEVVPNRLCRELESSEVELLGGDVSLSSLFHKHGVNMRYIPSVATRCTVSSVRAYLCEELFVRTLKVFIRNMWNTLIECSEWFLLDRVYELIVYLWPRAWQDEMLLLDVRRKYCEIESDMDSLTDELAQICSVDGHDWSLIFRFLSSLHIEYDHSLPVTNVDELVRHRESWRMQPDVSVLKAPEFVALHDREKQLQNEIKLRQSSHLSIVSPFRQLLGLYKVWSEEEAEVSRDHGVTVCDQLEDSIRSSDFSIEIADALRDIAEFLKHFGILDRSRRVSEECLSKLRLLLQTSEEDEDKSQCRRVRMALCASLDLLGRICDDQGDYESAVHSYTEAIELIQSLHEGRSEAEATTLNNLASVFANQGEYERALEKFHAALLIRKEKLGDEHPSVAATLNNIANVFEHQGAYERSLEYFQKALVVTEVALGDCHPSVGDILNNMAIVFCSWNQCSKALPLFQRALSISQHVFGMNHLNVAVAFNNIANVFREEEEYAEALRYYERALSIRKDTLGDDHPNVADTLNNMGNVYDSQGEYDESLRFYEKALLIRQQVLGEDHADVADTLNNIATVYDTLGEYDKSLRFYENALRITRDALGDTHPSVGLTLYNMGLLSVNQGSTNEAIAHFNEAKRIWLLTLPPDHPNILDVNVELQQLVAPTTD